MDRNNLEITQNKWSDRIHRTVLEAYTSNTRNVSQTQLYYDSYVVKNRQSSG